MVSSFLIYHEQPIKLHSGGLSNWFVDADRIWDDVNLRASVLNRWKRGSELWVRPLIVGIPTGGMKWAEAFAAILRCQVVTYQADVDYHKEFKGRTILGVDDVVTTGRSLRALSADWYYIVVDRSEGRLPVQAGGSLFYTPGLTAWMTVEL